MSEVLERVAGECGELVLRRSGADLEVIANGMFLMDTRNGESERLMVTVAADCSPKPLKILIGGLGVGFSLRAALDHPLVAEVVVVEREAAVIEWNRTGPLREVHADALADERVRVVRADLPSWLRRTEERFDALCLDIDNGPEWTVTAGNDAMYASGGLGLLADHLTTGGALAVWSAGDSAEFTATLRDRFNEVHSLEVAVPRGEPDIIWLARK